MKRILFIDANKYLDFYRVSQATEFLALLPAIKPFIFIPRQIVDEVHRNLLKVFPTVGSFQVPKACLPLSLLAEKDRATELLSEFETKRRAFEAHLREKFDATIKQVAALQDPTSRALKEVFDSAVMPSGDELRLARLRKELGNPPGKREDPLGDQLAWEQLLSRLGREEDSSVELWIVTTDKDYCVCKDRSIHLNPFLNHELETRKPGMKVTVRSFDALAESLPRFVRESKLSVSVPDEGHLRRTAEAEHRWDSLLPVSGLMGSSGFSSQGSSILAGTPTTGLPVTLTPLSHFHGFSVQSHGPVCPKCGHHPLIPFNRYISEGASLPASDFWCPDCNHEFGLNEVK